MEGYRKLHNKLFHNLYSSPNVSRVITWKIANVSDEHAAFIFWVVTPCSDVVKIPTFRMNKLPSSSGLWRRVVMWLRYRRFGWTCCLHLLHFTLTQLVKKFSAFYGTRRFITVLTRARRWSLSSSRWIQSTISNHISLRSIVILPSHPCVVVSFLQVFRQKFCTHFLSLPCILHAPPISFILLDLIAEIIVREAVIVCCM